MNEATIAKKQQEVQVVADKIANAGSTVFVDYLGLTVAEVTELRKKLHAENCEMKVVKNNILRRASSQAGYAAVEEHLVGPSAHSTLGTSEWKILSGTFPTTSIQSCLLARIGQSSHGL